jgi:dethiobiotin synthetase
VAARREGHPFALDEVLAARHAWSDLDLVVIEGAGGLLVPFADDLLAADLAAALEARLVIVGRAGLGTINHTLLTIFEARRRGLSLAGVVLNHASKTDDASIADNAAEIARIGQVTVLGPLPFGADEPAFALLDPLLSPEQEVAHE